MKASANWPGDVIPQTISFVIESCVFGVYGMLGMGLMLFCLSALRPGRAWKDKPLAISFWSINIGLVLMVVLSLLPVCIVQAWASAKYGTWYARSSEFLQTGSMNALRWMRIPGDTIFAFGMIVFAWFLLGLITGHSFVDEGRVEEGSWEVTAQAGSRGN